MNTKRLVITPATDTTDAVMESDTSLRLRAQRAYDGLSVAGPSGAYEYFARSASGLVRDARAISPSPANVTVPSCPLKATAQQRRRCLIPFAPF